MQKGDLPKERIPKKARLGKGGREGRRVYREERDSAINFLVFLSFSISISLFQRGKRRLALI